MDFCFKSSGKFLLLAVLVMVAGVLLFHGPARGLESNPVSMIHQNMNSAAGGDVNPGAVKAKGSRAVQKVLNGLPLYFEKNLGQFGGPAAFKAKGRTTDIYFTSQGLTLRLIKMNKKAGLSEYGRIAPASTAPISAKAWVVKLDFIGARQGVIPEGLGETPAMINYFKGAKKDHITGVPAYTGLIYRDLWPGVDLMFSGLGGKLKYVLAVNPGVDPRRIKLAFRGAESVTVSDGGGLFVGTPLGGFEDEPPVSYQEHKNGRATIATAYELESKGSRTILSFNVEDYDRSEVLYIDPAIMVYCGYIGGLDNDDGDVVAVDDEGSLYVAGKARSDDTTFPVTVGPDLTFNSVVDGDWMPEDAFAAKIKPDGSGLEYCGYIGGSDREWSSGIALDSEGAVYVVGATRSDESTFPVVGDWPFKTKHTSDDGFVAKILPDGSGLEFCGFFGGDDIDSISDIAFVEADKAIYLTGSTMSDETTFPVTVGPDLTQNSEDSEIDYDCFAAKINTEDLTVAYCGYIGGNQRDCGYSVAVDALGALYVSGFTRIYSGETTTFPVTDDWPFKTHMGGYDDIFAAKVKPDGTGLEYCGFIGGEGLDCPASGGLAVDAEGAAYVTGKTHSDETTFPVTVGPDLTFNGEYYDAFVLKINPEGTGLEYCGYIGGDQRETGGGLTVDAEGAAYVIGSTKSDETTFPVTGGWPDLTHNGEYDAFVAKVRSDGSGLEFCGYIGGSGEDDGYHIALDSKGSLYVTGTTTSTEVDESPFPVTVGPDLTHNGGDDAFAAKITPDNILTVQTDGAGTGTVTSNPAGIVCPGDCTEDYSAGTQVVLTGTPDDGSALDEWSGAGCPGNGICRATLTYNHTITASFNPDGDNDGASDIMENAGPNNGDGNSDGILDSEQNNAATFKDVNGNWVTLVSSAGTLALTSGCVSPSPDDAPDQCAFSAGFFGFTIKGLTAGESAVATFYLHEKDTTLNTYYKYGPTSNNQDDHWCEFKRSGESTGAVISQEANYTKVTLYLQDGLNGDDDLTANGEIPDVGGPASGPEAVTSTGGGGGSGGGCFISTLLEINQ